MKELQTASSYWQEEKHVLLSELAVIQGGKNCLEKDNLELTETLKSFHVKIRFLQKKIRSLLSLNTNLKKKVIEYEEELAKISDAKEWYLREAEKTKKKKKNSTRKRNNER